MTAATPPALDCPTDTSNGPYAAPRPVNTPTVGDSKGAAEGVPTAVRPDPQQGAGRYPVAWLLIVVPRGAVPTATSKCACGRDLFAAGHGKVLALIADHTAHRELCPLRNPIEGRAAA